MQNNHNPNDNRDNFNLNTLLSQMGAHVGGLQNQTGDVNDFARNMGNWGQNMGNWAQQFSQTQNQNNTRDDNRYHSRTQSHGRDEPSDNIFGNNNEHPINPNQNQHRTRFTSNSSDPQRNSQNHDNKNGKNSKNMHKELQDHEIFANAGHEFFSQGNYSKAKQLFFQAVVNL